MTMVATASHIANDNRIQAQVMTGQTGVRITGVPIPDMTDADVDAVRELISTYCVAVFPGQFLAPGDHLAFMRRFGPLLFTPGNDSHPEWPDIQVVKNLGAPGLGVSGPFHTDTCFVEQPPSYSSLCAVEVPERGGDTVFLNQYVAYDSLSDVMKGWLSGLRFKHVVTGTARPEEVPNPVWHPAVRTNPVTGRQALYVTMPIRCVEAEGMAPAEGANLIAFLYQHSQKLHAMYRHHWQPGDLVVWDNRCALHAAVYDHETQPRTLTRVMCEGERPYQG
jgi:taurine dioxygenase